MRMTSEKTGLMVQRKDEKKYGKDHPLPLIFLHIEKAAGTTLRQVIKRQYGGGNVHDYLQGPKAFAEIPPNVKAIQGHIQFGFYPRLPAPATWITVLRDPVDRLISAYNYILQTPDHFAYQYALRRNVKDFILDGMHIWSENAQVKYLSGAIDVAFGACREDHFRAARRNLQEHFSFVGLAERFDETLILLKRILGWKTPYYTRENISNKRVRKQDLSAEVLKIIEDHHLWDRRLYEYARERFERELDRQDGSFANEVRVFKLVNEYSGSYLDQIENGEPFPQVETRIAAATVHRLLSESKFREAEMVINYFLKIYPEAADLHNLRGQWLYQRGQPEEAKRVFTELTKRFFRHPGAYANLGILLWEAGEREEAMKFFTDALKRDPRHRDAVIYCGKAMQTFEFNDEAYRLYSQYLEAHPRDGEVHYLRNRLLKKP